MTRTILASLAAALAIALGPPGPMPAEAAQKLQAKRPCPQPHKTGKPMMDEPLILSVHGEIGKKCALGFSAKRPPAQRTRRK